MTTDKIELNLPYDGVRVEMLTIAADHLYEVDQKGRPVTDLDLPWIRCQLLDLRDVLALPRKGTTNDTV
jgi:hypothetical protein